MRKPWEFEDPACVDVGTEVFYPEDIDGPQGYRYPESLERLCGGCIHLRECRDWALLHEDHGYWGGTSSKQREAIRKTQRIGLRNLSAARPNQTKAIRQSA